jgi:hypothetical protein
MIRHHSPVHLSAIPGASQVLNRRSILRLSPVCPSYPHLTASQSPRGYHDHAPGREARATGAKKRRGTPRSGTLKVYFVDAGETIWGCTMHELSPWRPRSIRRVLRLSPNLSQGFLLPNDIRYGVRPGFEQPINLLFCFKATRDITLLLKSGFLK